MSVEVGEQLYVDSTTSDTRVDINFDITFNKLSCDRKSKIFTNIMSMNLVISVDVMENAGKSQDDITHDIFRQRLDTNGQIIEGTKPEKQSNL